MYHAIRKLALLKGAVGKRRGVEGGETERGMEGNEKMSQFLFHTHFIYRVYSMKTEEGLREPGRRGVAGKREKVRDEQSTRVYTCIYTYKDVLIKSIVVC